MRRGVRRMNRLSVFSCVMGCVMQLAGCSMGVSYRAEAEEDSVNKMNMEEKMYAYKYPHPSVTTDNVIFGFDGNTVKVLLIERGGEPYKGCWAFPGGFRDGVDNAVREAVSCLYSS